MNDGKILSLGNIFNSIKELSSGDSALQSEMFCSLFNVKNINNTTVNNYCIGIRAIGVLYKKYYIDLQEEYKNNHDAYVDIVLSLISILDEHIYIRSDKSLKIINSNHKLNKLCVKLKDICLIDENIQNDFVNRMAKYIDNNMLYECIIDILNYAIIENKQPIYSQDINIKINSKELNEYLSIKLYEGVSYITSLIELSKRNNMYACAELGSLEFDGLIDGNKNYDKSYNYYMIAALKGHPKACWMIANMILSNKVTFNMDVMWSYLNKSISLGSAAGLNTLGLCYLRGINPLNIKDINKAIKYFTLSSKYGYAYAFNNLGKIYEETNIEKAIKYYKISSDLGESWALNKVGEYYRMKGEMDAAFYYYSKSDECPISERCSWASYNIKKYFK